MPDERVSPQLRGTKQAKKPAARGNGGHLDSRAHSWFNWLYPINS
jgi:hypothetical protein